MAIEIGSLVVRGSFGTAANSSEKTSAEMNRKIDALRNDLIEVVEARIEEARRRDKER